MPGKKAEHNSDTTIASTVPSDTTSVPTTETTSVAESETTTVVSNKGYTPKSKPPPSQPLGEQFKLGFLVANGSYELADDYDAVRAAAVAAKDKTRIALADAGWKLKEANDRDSITTKWPPKIACCSIFWTLGHYPMWSEKVTKLKRDAAPAFHGAPSKSQPEKVKQEESETEGTESEVVEESEVVGADGKITKVKRFKKIHNEKLEWGKQERPPPPWAIQPKASIAEGEDHEKAKKRKKSKVFHEKLEWKVKDRVPLSGHPRASKAERDDESLSSESEFDETGKIVPKKERAPKVFHEKLEWKTKDRVPLFTPGEHKPKHKDHDGKKKKKKTGVFESEMSIVDKPKKERTPLYTAPASKDRNESILEPETGHKKKGKKKKEKFPGGPEVEESQLTIQTQSEDHEPEEKHKKHKKSKAHPEVDASAADLHKKHKKSKVHPEVDASAEDLHKKAKKSRAKSLKPHESDELDAKARKSRAKSLKPHESDELDAKARKSRAKSLKQHKLDDGDETEEIRGRPHDPMDSARDSIFTLDEESSASEHVKGTKGKKGKKSLKPKTQAEAGDTTPIARNLSTHRLRVSNLPIGVTIEDLRQLFPGGTITLETIGTDAKPKTVAEIKYKEESDTLQAFKSSKKAELFGKPLVVSPMVRE